MRVLLHTCCAVCTIGPVRDLRAEGHDVTGCFVNPNVHPLIEFRRRLKAMKVLGERLDLKVICENDYGLRDWLERVDWRAEPAERCEACYRMRLGRVAEMAATRNFDAMSTTLLISRQQDHEAVRRIGEECAVAAGVEFLYRDWRPLADQSHDEAQRLRLYLQQYCGCILSEYERFKDTRKHLYRGDEA